VVSPVVASPVEPALVSLVPSVVDASVVPALVEVSEVAPLELVVASAVVDDGFSVSPPDDSVLEPSVSPAGPSSEPQPRKEALNAVNKAKVRADTARVPSSDSWVKASRTRSGRPGV
jgi:hypothetical protein